MIRERYITGDILEVCRGHYKQQFNLENYDRAQKRIMKSNREVENNNQ